MWQSSGKFQPRADQLARIAPVIVEMGCFARVETNGGAFEQVNLLYGETVEMASFGHYFGTILKEYFTYSAYSIATPNKIENL